MRWTMSLLALVVLTGLALLPSACVNTPPLNDHQAIETLLGTSDYTSDANSTVADDGTTEPKRDSFGSAPGPMLTMPGDTLPWIRFARAIERPVQRTVTITIPAYPGYPDTTALAVITVSLGGRFYVLNDSLSHIAWVKDFVDDGIRKVYLTKHRHDWQIRKMTPLNYVTRSAPWTVNIASLRLAARPSGLTYEYTSPDTMLTKDQLPAFLRGDTVKVTVTVQSDSATWVFLHWGDGYFHQREAFYRTSPTTFEREWWLDKDSLIRTVVVRSNAADVISWPTLFGDTLSPYNSRAWVMPYMVLKTPNQERP